MFLNFIGNFKEACRLKSIFNGDISPAQGESYRIEYPHETNQQDLIKKLIRYYYLTDHQVPTGKIEAVRSKDLPEMEHEYVLPIRKKISAAILACRNQMREAMRQKNFETFLGGFFYIASACFLTLKVVCPAPLGRFLLGAEGGLAIILLVGWIQSSRLHKPRINP